MWAMSIYAKLIAWTFAKKIGIVESIYITQLQFLITWSFFLVKDLGFLWYSSFWEAQIFFKWLKKTELQNMYLKYITHHTRTKSMQPVLGCIILIWPVL